MYKIALILVFVAVAFASDLVQEDGPTEADQQPGPSPLDQEPGPSAQDQAPGPAADNRNEVFKKLAKAQKYVNKVAAYRGRGVGTAPYVGVPGTPLERRPAYGYHGDRAYAGHGNQYYGKAGGYGYGGKAYAAPYGAYDDGYYNRGPYGGPYY